MNINEIINLVKEIDYSEALQVLINYSIGFSISYYVNNKIKKYELHKEFERLKTQKIILPPELRQEYSHEDIEKAISRCIEKSILEFAQFMVKKYREEDLKNFIENINKLKMKKIDLALFNAIQSPFTGTYAYGSYECFNNEITLDCEDKTLSIFHELFHMSSSRTIINNEGWQCYSGFGYSDSNDLTIGNSLNEGYTELLEERYFGNKQIERTYPMEKEISLALELIVDQDKMERLYLNANLPGLINELKQYASEEEIRTFILNLDFLGYCKGKLSKQEIKNIKKRLNDIYKFLLKSIDKKISIVFQKDKAIFYQNHDLLLMLYFKTLPKKWKIDRHTIVLNNEDLLESMLLCNSSETKKNNKSRH